MDVMYFLLLYRIASNSLFLELHQYMKLFPSLLLKIVVCSTRMLLLNASDEGRLCRAGKLCLIAAFVNIYWVVLSTEPTA